MLKSIGSQVKSAVAEVPFVKNYLLSKQYSTEIALIKGTHSATSEHPSILHFSVNKSATQYVKSILKECAAANNLTNVGIHDYAFKSDFPYLNKLSGDEMCQYQHIFKPQGYTYSVFGGMIDGILDLNQYLVVLMVRDLRDVLVSEYYSVAYSHVPPTDGGDKYETFLKDRQFARTSTVDEYVINRCDTVYRTYDRYRHLLLDVHPNVYVTKYEDMIADFKTWLTALVDYCQLNLSDELLENLVAQNNALRPTSENVKKHIRKGKAGDYKEKLKPETITYIESRLLPLLHLFGYA